MKPRNVFPLLFLLLASCAGSPAQQATRARLRETRIIEVRFEEADITDVIAFLMRVSREEDPTPGPGCCIVFMEHVKPAGTPLPPGSDPFGFGAPEESNSESNTLVPRITMEMRNATVEEILDAVCDLAGLRWRIHENGTILID